MIQSANAISDLHNMMMQRGLSASGYPMLGSGLLTAASIHVICTVFDWDSMRQVTTRTTSIHYLKQDMEGINDLGQRWDLAIHWVSRTTKTPWPL